MDMISLIQSKAQLYDIDANTWLGVSKRIWQGQHAKDFTIHKQGHGSHMQSSQKHPRLEIGLRE